MIFNSLAYMLLLFLSRLVLPLTTAPALVLLSSSIIFYIFAGPFDFIIFASSLIFNWLIAIAVRGTQPRILVAVIFNLGLLFFFKYADFFFSLQFEAEKTTSSFIDLALPLGISFYTFQILSYHIDVARGHASEATKLQHFILFISFFPQLVAGPIVRSYCLLPQIERLFQGQRKKIYLLSFGFSLIIL
ncbi:MAG: hypothetical protein P8P76_04555, partial [Alphaproteobacteria bacterium]|nr:hypothetical protein [Alphaproteobacteria bacterium]